MDFDGADPIPSRSAVLTGPPAPQSPDAPATTAAGTAATQADEPRTTPATSGVATPILPPPNRSVEPANPSRVERGSRAWRWIRRAALLALALVAGLLALMIVFRSVDPWGTPVMAVRSLMGEPVDQRWVPLDRISPRLMQAVVASEDARFCLHKGIDYGALRAAIEDTRRGNPRGGSTITMQVVKNLFLWPQRSYLRKALELPLALALDFLWPKRRILEVYLNIAEWGPGIYGAEIAAQRAFGKPAARLTTSEAARLAVSLPNPAERDAGEPDETVERLAARLEARMGGNLPLGCLR